MIKKISIWIIALSLVACATQNTGGVARTSDQLVKDAKASIKEVSIDDVKKMIDNRKKS